MLVSQAEVLQGTYSAVLKLPATYIIDIPMCTREEETVTAMPPIPARSYASTGVHDGSGVPGAVCRTNA